MAFRLDKVVPWGRTLEEYTEMFALTDADLGKRIAGFGDGPASFNAEWTQKGGRVVSFDPVYACTEAALRQRVQETKTVVLEQTRKNLQNYNWKRFGSLAGLEQNRMTAMERFFRDFARGSAEGRYVAHTLPERVPEADGAFDLGLSSHFLLLYPQLGLPFHIDAIGEMLRVCREVRIFPLLDLDGRHSALTEQVITHFKKGFRVETVHSPYEFLKGANEMLVIRHA